MAQVKNKVRLRDAVENLPDQKAPPERDREHQGHWRSPTFIQGHRNHLRDAHYMPALITLTAVKKDHEWENIRA